MTKLGGSFIVHADHTEIFILDLGTLREVWELLRLTRCLLAPFLRFRAAGVSLSSSSSSSGSDSELMSTPSLSSLSTRFFAALLFRVDWEAAFCASLDDEAAAAVLFALF